MLDPRVTVGLEPQRLLSAAIAHEFTSTSGSRISRSNYPESRPGHGFDESQNQGGATRYVLEQPGNVYVSLADQTLAVQFLEVVADLDHAESVHDGVSHYALNEDVTAAVVRQRQTEGVFRFD